MTADSLFQNQDSDRLFIIGNGFDISLGLNTRYSDFADSPFWPENVDNEYFYAYLNDYRKESNWFDIEQILGQYEKSMGRTIPINYKGRLYRPTQTKDAIYFEELQSQLVAYLKKEQTKDLQSTSVAARILKSVRENGFFKRIVSFNYTDLNMIGDKIGLNMDGIDIEYMHGNLENGIVLGVPDGIDLSSKYDFLYKTSSRHYASHPLPYYLNTASEIVFFGHSMSDNDFFYFEDLYNKQINLELSKIESKIITIFTYDENSRLSILRQLRKHLKGNLSLLYALNDFSLIKTDGSDNDKIDAFIKRQNETNLVNSIQVASLPYSN